MTIILFVLDTSASMNQRTNVGTTIFDIAKTTVDLIRKGRKQCAGDKYMLMTTDAFPGNVKVGWKDTSTTVLDDQLRNVTAHSCRPTSSVIGNALHMLHLNRAPTGIDNCGYGRHPYYMLPTHIVLITDGACTSEEIVPPPVPDDAPGSEYYADPYRWDQRIHSIVLRYSAQHAIHPSAGVNAQVTSDHMSPIDRLCGRTGGRSFSVRNGRQLQCAVDALIGTINRLSVCVQWRRVGEQGNVLPWHHTITPLIVKTVNKGHWPIPEAYFGNVRMTRLPARSAHPTLHFDCRPMEPVLCAEFPFDKYEMEPTSLTRHFLLDCPVDKVWHVWVEGSASAVKPFAYLKHSSTGQATLVVMPYNFAQLIPLLNTFKAKKGGNEILAQLAAYMRTVPSYYVNNVMKELSAFGVERLSEHLSGVTAQPFHSSLVSYFNRTKVTAKDVLERFSAAVSKQISLTTTSDLVHLSDVYLRTIALSVDDHLFAPPPSTSEEDPLAKVDRRYKVEENGKWVTDTMSTFDEVYGQVTVHMHKHELHGGHCAWASGSSTGQRGDSYVNAYDIKELLAQSRSIRLNWRHGLSLASGQSRSLNGGVAGQLLTMHTAHNLHWLTSVDMSNYVRYTSAYKECGRAALQAIDPAPLRIHTFGNPFKLDKKSQMMVDEAAVDDLTDAKTEKKGRQLLRRRKIGPLPKSFTFLKKLREHRGVGTDTQSAMGDDRLPPSPSTSSDDDDDNDAMSTTSAPAAISDERITLEESSSEGEQEEEASSSSDSSSSDSSVELIMANGGYSPPPAKKKRLSSGLFANSDVFDNGLSSASPSTQQLVNGHGTKTTQQHSDEHRRLRRAIREQGCRGIASITSVFASVRDADQLTSLATFCKKEMADWSKDAAFGRRLEETIGQCRRRVGEGRRRRTRPG